MQRLANQAEQLIMHDRFVEKGRGAGGEGPLLVFLAVPAGDDDDGNLRRLSSRFNHSMMRKPSHATLPMSGGKVRSSRIKSGFCVRTALTAVAPSRADTTSKPPAWSFTVSALMITASSSTTKIFFLFIFAFVPDPLAR